MDIFNWLWWFGFRLEPIFASAPAEILIILASKVVKSDSKIIISICQFKSLTLCIIWDSNTTLISFCFFSRKLRQIRIPLAYRRLELNKIATVLGRNRRDLRENVVKSSSLKRALKIWWQFKFICPNYIFLFAQRLRKVAPGWVREGDDRLIWSG